MKDYEKLWFHLKDILSDEQSRHARRTLNTMAKLEEIQPISVFRKHVEGEWKYAPKGIRKFFKR